jgi:hypothetical protein
MGYEFYNRFTHDRISIGVFQKTSRVEISIPLGSVPMGELP